MPLSDESRGRLAAALAGDIPLFEEVDAEMVTSESERNRLEGEVDSLKGAVDAKDKRIVELLEQVSNLYSKLPGSASFKKPGTAEEQVKEILGKDW